MADLFIQEVTGSYQDHRKRLGNVSLVDSDARAKQDRTEPTNFKNRSCRGEKNEHSK